jgi:hypothetical protein
MCRIGKVLARFQRAVGRRSYRPGVGKERLRLANFPTPLRGEPLTAEPWKEIGQFKDSEEISLPRNVGRVEVAFSALRSS